MEGVIPKLLNFLGKLRSYFTGAASNGRFKDSSEGVRRTVRGINRESEILVCVCVCARVHPTVYIVPSVMTLTFICIPVKNPKKSNYTKLPYSLFPSILWDFTFGG